MQSLMPFPLDEPLSGWQANETGTQKISNQWLTAGAALLFAMPSALVLQPRNYVVNPYLAQAAKHLSETDASRADAGLFLQLAPAGSTCLSTEAHTGFRAGEGCPQGVLRYRRPFSAVQVRAGASARDENTSHHASFQVVGHGTSKVDAAGQREPAHQLTVIARPQIQLVGLVVLHRRDVLAYGSNPVKSGDPKKPCLNE